MTVAGDFSVDSIELPGTKRERESARMSGRLVACWHEFKASGLNLTGSGRARAIDDANGIRNAACRIAYIVNERGNSRKPAQCATD